ncbi:hypothetical protein B9T66_08350 [Helicobacter sp. TUL]|uniref:Ig-like domain-containing protein n=1 Tax=Helicobacter sp. TUL TaxID=1848928 RepID=UPI000BAB71DF|nr:Ig-like domain-containing protein [Helicobacter sp. TUL]PAU99211.1 hypothetical protein B9T66_08350 [Helicobacter sp. TUL]
MSNTQNTQTYSKETIRIRIRDMQDNPIVNAKVILLAMGLKTGQKIPLDGTTDSNGEILFDSKPYLKDINRFEITIEHKDYYTYPKNRVRKLCRSYEYGHLCEESFEKIPSFYYNGTTLTLSQSDCTTKYTLRNSSSQAHNHTQEYYIQLQENSTSLKIYTDENLTQKSNYTLSLDTQYTQQSQDLQTQSRQSQSNDTILSFDSKDSLRQFTNDIQEIIIKDKKKGHANLVHRFVVGISGEYTSLLFLDKPQGRIVKIEIPKENVSDSIVANTESNQTRILKSWAKTNQKITEQDIRKIAFSTIDIINRKDMSKNPLIYKALDKLISDYRIYKDNFPQEYYVDFGRYMVENANTHNDLVKTFENLIYFMYSKRKGASEEGGIAIFHLYENYVPKFEGDENGLDKVIHFLESAKLTYILRDPDYVRSLGVANEIKDFVIGGGFSNDDILANEQGIQFALELLEKNGLMLSPARF